jgi:hypothetical protein
MSKSIIIVLGFVAFSISCMPAVHAATSAKVTARVVNEEGVPVHNANVTVGFLLAKKGGVGADSYREEGRSDSQGMFTATGNTIIPQVTIHADFDGYYRSSKWAKFTSRSLLLRRWEPWNPTIEVVLKKKRNPVPMYDNHRTTYKVPKFDTPMGFDLEKEDWILPYGKGVVSDFIITFDSEIRAYTDYDCNFTLSFSNEHDGIQEYYFSKDDQSYYKWPFEAPVDGYKKKLFKEKSISLPEKGYYSNEKDNLNYLFRVRSKVDKNGNIMEAKYGKLIGEFGFSPKGKITFRYIFNPDGTRNLEEDPGRNLFKNK